MITAREYRSHVAGASQAEYQTLENRIDQAIAAAAAHGQDRASVHLDGVPQAVRERAVSEYTVAGWDIKVISDYRDGDSLWLRCP